MYTRQGCCWRSPACVTWARKRMLFYFVFMSFFLKWGGNQCVVHCFGACVCVEKRLFLSSLLLCVTTLRIYSRVSSQFPSMLLYRHSCVYSSSFLRFNYSFSKYSDAQLTLPSLPPSLPPLSSGSSATAPRRFLPVPSRS